MNVGNFKIFGFRGKVISNQWVLREGELVILKKKLRSLIVQSYNYILSSQY